MEILYESEEDIAVKLEKICGDWNIYAKLIKRPRPQPWRLN